jgi:integrase/recombinase XerD
MYGNSHGARSSAVRRPNTKRYVSDVTLQGMSPASRQTPSFETKISERSDRISRGSARTLDEDQLERLITFIRDRSNAPEADLVKVLLTFQAGLRIGEVASLRLSDVTDASGRISKIIVVRASNAKNGEAREIPMTPGIRYAIERFRVRYPDVDYFAVSSRYGTPKRQGLTAITNYVWRLYRAAGLEGCSSHSGRRTFATFLAREHSRAGKSLRDVQKLLGHARLDTTERYIEVSHDLTGLVGLFGNKFGKPKR